MDGNTLLLRQIHPKFVQGDKVTSQAFRPTPKDEGKLSVYDGDQIEPEPAWQHFIQDPKCSSAGVMAVTGGECEALKLPYQLTGHPYAEHAEIDFTALNTNQTEKASKKLKAKAEARGWLYRAPAEE